MLFTRLGVVKDFPIPLIFVTPFCIKEILTNNLVRILITTLLYNNHTLHGLPC